MVIKMNCKFFPKTLCLTGDPKKCSVLYNEFNSACPYYKVYLKENNILAGKPNKCLENSAMPQPEVRYALTKPITIK
jgi:hypothetical protein